MTTSIMCATYNRLDLTKRTIENLCKTIDTPFRFIVIDNGSSDKTPDYLRNELGDIIIANKHCVSYDFKLNEKNLGIASARNQGLQIADKYEDEYLCTIDNDVEMPNGWLKECIDIMAVNPKLSIGVNMEGVSYPVITRNGKTFQYKMAGNLGTACMVFDRRLHNLIGFFTTEYNFYGEEDSDFGYRSRVVSYELGYIKENGNHFGVGDLDVGEYREFKDECRKGNLSKFRRNCFDYSNGKKPVYIPFSIKEL